MARTTAAWSRVNITSVVGVSGYMQRDHVVRPQLRFDEPRQRLAHRDGVRLAHVIVVEEDGEQPHVLALRLGLLVVAVPDGARRRFAGTRVVAVDPDELELLDRLRLVVFEDLEVSFLQIGDRLPLRSVANTSTRMKSTPVRKVVGCRAARAVPALLAAGAAVAVAPAAAPPGAGADEAGDSEQDRHGHARLEHLGLGDRRAVTAGSRCPVACSSAFSLMMSTAPVTQPADFTRMPLSATLPVGRRAALP